MKKSIRKLIVGALAISNFLLLFPQKVYSAEAPKPAGTEQIIQDETPKEKSRLFKLNANFLINELVRGGSVDITTQKEYITNFFGKLNEKTSVSYEYAIAGSNNQELLAKERTKRERKLLRAEYNLSKGGKPFINVSYFSDQNNLVYFVHSTAGIEREVADGLKFELGVGIKSGKIDNKSETYDVINLTGSYKTPEKREQNLEVRARTFLPRKNLTGDGFKGKYFIQLNVKLSLGKIWGFNPVIGARAERTYLPVDDGIKGLWRYGVDLGFSLQKGGKVNN